MVADKPNPSTSWPDGLCCPSLGKRRGVTALPSLFEREGLGVSFQSWISKSLNTGHRKMDFSDQFLYNEKNFSQEN
jgi:hypothetical protein